MTFIPRPLQIEGWNAVTDYWESGGKHPLVVVPTGGGKTGLYALGIKQSIQQYPDTRILLLCHVAELLTQTFRQLMEMWPEAPAGVYSAGLRSRDLQSQIVFASIQSIYRRAHEIGRVDFVIIDEAHLLGRKSTGMYRKFLADLERLNPLVKICGGTATPFRTDSGMLHEGDEAIFTDIVYEVNVRDLIDNGTLCRPVTGNTKARINTDGIGTRAGDYIIDQLEAAALEPETVRAVCDEIVAAGANRAGGILVFSCGIKHANMLCDGLRARGIVAETIFGETPQDQRSKIIDAYKKQEIRALVSVAVLTTGFDAPVTSTLAVVRPTKSNVLWIQMVGRGLRNFPGKTECLVLDFGQNTMRMGTIDAPIVRAPKKKTDESAAAPTKICPECGEENPLSARWCIKCSAVFDTPERMVATRASTLSVISTAEPEWLPVTSVHYRRWQKEDKPDSIRVTYMCGMTAVSEWCCLWHSGPVRQRAERWWFERGGALLPKTIEEALERAPKLRCPTEIAVRRSGKWFEIVGHRFAAVTDNVVEFRRKS